MSKLVSLFTRFIFIILIIFFCVSRFDKLLFDKSDALIAKYQKKIIKRAHKKNIYGFFSFDSGIVNDSILGKTSINYGAKLIDGEKNGARYFDGSNKTYIDTDYHWGNLGSQYTISIYVKIERKKTTQAFLCQQEYDRLKSGIMLQNGRIIFYIPFNQKNQAASFDFNNYGKWVYIAAVCDLKNKTAMLYENGILKDSIKIEDVTHLNTTVKFGKYKPKQVYYPFTGAIDEVIFFKKALNEKEIKKIYKNKGSIYNKISPIHLLKYNLLNSLRSFILIWEHVFDFFNPFYHESYILKSKLPQFDLIFSKNDIKHFTQQFNQSKIDGFFSKNDKHRAEIFFNDKLYKIKIKLFDNNQFIINSHRKSFIIESECFEDCKSCFLDKCGLDKSSLKNKKIKKMVFIPFDEAGYLKPLFNSALLNNFMNGNIINGISALKINSVFSGLYYYEMFEEGNPLLFQYNKTSSSYFKITQMMEIIKTFISEEKILSFYEDLRERYKKILLSDRAAYVSIREINYYIKQNFNSIKNNLHYLEKITTQKKIDLLYDFISPNVLLNKNPSYNYIVEDLNFNIFNLPNVEISFLSSNPSYISNEGKVIRHESLHIDVDVIVTIKVGQEIRKKTLSYVVIPQNVTIPIVVIKSFEDVHNIQKVKCSISYISDKKQLLDLSGNIRYRGNTALFYEKKSYSIETEIPHNLFETSSCNRFNLMGVLPDKTFMRNSLAYGLFNSFKDEKSPNNIAPKIRLVELFLNNEYLGIYELSEKVDSDMFHFNFNSKDENHSVIYKSQGSKATFENVRWHNYLQKYPDFSKVFYFQPYKALMKFLSSAPTIVFKNKAEDYIDIYNSIDFQILVNLCFNKDGVNHNLYLIKNIATSDKFFLVPWDYDKSFGLNFDGWLDNFLFKRLRHDLPGYKEKFKKRWFELRSKQLKYESIIDRIDSMEKEISPRVKYNLRKWKIEEDRHDIAIKELKSWIFERLKFMDNFIESL